MTCRKPGLELVHEPLRRGQVAGEDRRGEPERDRVRAADRVVERVEAVERRDRPEDLLARELTVAALVCPVFAFAFVFAEELVSLVYTSAYVGAAPVMRVYIVGLAALVLELLTVTMLLRLAPFVLASISRHSPLR